MPACMKMLPATSVTIGLPRSHAPYLPFGERASLYSTNPSGCVVSHASFGLRVDRRHRLALLLLRGARASRSPPTPSCAPLLGIGIGERREDLARRVARLADQVHHLVIAEQREGAAAGVLGLVLERHQQVEHRARAFAAIHVVAGLNQLRAAAGPLAAAVVEAGDLQDRLEAVDAAVDVADGDDARAIARRAAQPA